jgi:hypothetical protein
MKWGRRRYQNEDGTYTELGKARRSKEYAKKDRLSDKGVEDVDRWVTDDIKRYQSATRAGEDVVRELQKMERESSPKPIKERMDLSNMTDKELRDRINRELTERQYNDLFGKTKKPTISKGREYARNVLDVAGSVLGIGTSSLAIALAIKELRS